MLVVDKSYFIRWIASLLPTKLRLWPILCPPIIDSLEMVIGTALVFCPAHTVPQWTQIASFQYSISYPTSESCLIPYVPIQQHYYVRCVRKVGLLIFLALQLLPLRQLNSLGDLIQCNFQWTPQESWWVVGIGKHTQNMLSPWGPAVPKRKGKWVWVTLLSNNKTAQSARKGLKLITAQEVWAHMLCYSCLLIAVKIGPL